MKVCMRLKRKTGTWVYGTRSGRTYYFTGNKVCYDMSEADYKEIMNTGMVEEVKEEKVEKEEVKKEVKKKRGSRKKKKK